MTLPIDLRSSAVLFIGAGRMGGEILKAMLQRMRAYFATPSIATVTGATKLGNASDASSIDQLELIEIATKPDDVLSAAKAVSEAARPEAIVLSEAAGVTLTSLRAVVGPSRMLVRMMPNLPAAVGAGTLAAASDTALAQERKEDLTSVFEEVGTLFWFDDDAQFDAITALSGSGPAYFIRLAETMAEAASRMGLPEDIAPAMARETLIGTGKLVGEENMALPALRESVTSPNGTTHAALTTCAAGGLDQLVGEAMSAAAARSLELSTAT